MAVVGHLHKIVFGGRLAVTETWSCSIHALTAGDGIITGEMCGAALRDWMGRADSNCNASAFLDWVKVNEINPIDGKYVQVNPTPEHFLAPPVPGNATTDYPHLSIAVSTVTDATRGYASKGRFFPPSGHGFPAAGDGRVSAAAALSMSVSAAQLITDLNGSFSGDCVVFSKVGQTTRSLTGTRVGRVSDVQSRRRRNLIEDHQFAPIS